MKTSLFSRQLSIEDELTSLQADSPANPSPMQVKEREQKMTVTSGLKCLESYKRFAQHSSWVRMFLASLIGVDKKEEVKWYSTKCALIWKLRATKSHRLYFQLVAKTHRIEEIESSLLPTPRLNDYKGGTAKERVDGGSRKGELCHFISQQIGKASQLSPLFVEEMMGFPKGWTASPFQSGEEKP